MIGLRRGTVRLVKHSSAWGRSFRREKRKLETVFGKEAIDIQHVGSTAIRAVRAKPVIDIAVTVSSLPRAKKMQLALRRIGYVLKKNDARTERLFFTKGPKTKRTHYLHVGKVGSGYIEDMILFRDYLHAHKRAARDYDKLKTELSKVYSQKRGRYTKLKEQFVRKVVRQASKAT